MPFRGTPTCLKCETNESPMWTNAENLGAICLNCVNETKQKLELEEDEDDSSKPKRKLRTTRSYKTRLNQQTAPKSGAPKGRGRRGLFKRTPVKAPAAVATPVTSNFIFYKGTYIQVGDIVSMKDEDDDVYYAQITGLLTDQYCEKSAVITWLLPTQESPPPNERFDPATYIIGLEEDIPRKLDYMEFVMHAPSDYYKSKTTPYPTVHAPAQPGYIWSTMETIQRICNGIPEKNEDSEVNDDNKEDDIEVESNGDEIKDVEVAEDVQATDVEKDVQEINIEEDVQVINDEENEENKNSMPEDNVEMIEENLIENEMVSKDSEMVDVKNENETDVI